MEPFVEPLNTYFVRYDITSVRRMAAFFGQAMVECGSFTMLEEHLNYTVDNVRSKFPRRLRETHAKAEDYAGNPEKLGNWAYADKNGNGDEASGDGYKYRGRGVLQVTGRANYQAAADDTGLPLVAHPELLAQPAAAVFCIMRVLGTSQRKP
jgi:putative chitinase